MFSLLMSKNSPLIHHLHLDPSQVCAQPCVHAHVRFMEAAVTCTDLGGIKKGNPSAVRRSERERWRKPPRPLYCLFVFCVWFERALIVLCSSPDRMRADRETPESVPTVRWGFPWQPKQREDTGLPSLLPSFPSFLQFLSLSQSLSQGW